MAGRRLAVLAAALALASSVAWAVSEEEEIGLGRMVMAEVRPMNLTADPSLQQIGRRLATVVSRQELPWRFWVVEDWDSYNAFAAPGGFVFISRKYYQKLSTDEAAFVIGHEMAHVDLNHYQRHLRRSREADVGHLLLNILLGGQGGAAWRTATDLGATAYMTHYSRALEKEADLTGYRYAQAAGYDARLAVTALSKLGEQPNVHPWIVNLYGTHPLLSSREDRLAAIGGQEPEEVPAPEPDPAHRRDLTGGLEPFEPTVPIAIRILGPDGQRWENPWRKNLTRRLHLRLLPHGFSIAGDDLMYKPDIGDPVEAARSRHARYLLLVTVNDMESWQTGAVSIRGTRVEATVDVGARLLLVADGSVVWEGRYSERSEGRDILPPDPAILYPDTCLGALVDGVVGEIGQACAKAAGARPAEAAEQESPPQAAQ